MALVSRSGSSTQSSVPQQLTDAIGTANVPLNQPGVTAGDNTVKNATDALQNLPELRDPALDRLTFDTSQYIETLNSIQGYNKGTRITVVYFQQLNENWNRRSNTVDTPTMRNAIDIAYRRINNFEITLPEPWSYSYDQDQGGSDLKGTALFYPGMNPKVGDIFYANVGDGKLGEFKISSIRPMTWRTQKGYEVSYFLYNFPGSIDVFPQQASTVQTLNFVKGNYLGDTVALLTQSQADDLQTLAVQRAVLGKLYYRDFYDGILNSFVIPHSGKAYDPYLVKFVNLLLPYSVVKKRSRQLWPSVDETYDSTIWSTLNDQTMTDLGMVIPFYRLETYRIPNMGVGATTLTNRGHVIVDGTAATDYAAWLASQPTPTPSTDTGSSASTTGGSDASPTPADATGADTGTTSTTTTPTTDPTAGGTSTSETPTVTQPTDDMDIGEYPSASQSSTGGGSTSSSTGDNSTSTTGNTTDATTTAPIGVSSELDLSPDPAGPGFLYPDDPIQGGVYQTITPVLQNISIPSNGYYAFSKDFYEGNLPGMTLLEQVLYTVIVNRQYTDTQTLISLVRTMKTADPIDKFYGIPALLKIIDIATSSVGNGAALGN